MGAKRRRHNLVVYGGRWRPLATLILCYSVKACSLHVLGGLGHVLKGVTVLSRCRRWEPLGRDVLRQHRRTTHVPLPGLRLPCLRCLQRSFLHEHSEQEIKASRYTYVYIRNGLRSRTQRLSPVRYRVQHTRAAEPRLCEFR